MRVLLLVSLVPIVLALGSRDVSSGNSLRTSFGGVPGEGIDLITGERKTKVVGLDWSQTQDVDVDGKTVKLPKDLDVETVHGKIFKVRKTYLFNNFEEYESQVNEWRGDGEAAAGLFTWSDEVREMFRDIFQRNLAVIIIQQTHTFYNARLRDGRSFGLARLCEKAVEGLPEEYDQDHYFEFIKNYGNYYVESARFGGMIQLMVAFEKDVFKTIPGQMLKEQAQLDLDRKLGVSETQLNPDYSKNLKQSNFWYFGGVSEFEPNQWKQWLDSIRDNPVVLHFKSDKVSALLATPKRLLLEKAVTTYFVSWSECRERGCISHGDCRMDGGCKCDYGWGDRYCSTQYGQFASTSRVIPTLPWNPQTARTGKFFGSAVESQPGLVFKSTANSKALELVAADLKNTILSNVTTLVSDEVIENFLVADINGDGMDDILAKGAEYWSTFMNLGGGDFAGLKAKKPISGVPEIVGHFKLGSSYAHAVLLEESNIVTLSTFGDGNWSVSTAALEANNNCHFFGNFDQSGRLTLLNVVNSTRWTTLSLEDDLSWSPNTWSPPDEMFVNCAKAVTGDFNGDDYTDIATADGESIHFHFSNGNGKFHSKEWRDPHLSHIDLQQSCVVDVNDDHIDDVVGHYGHVWMTLMSQGDEEFTPIVWSNANLPVPTEKAFLKSVQVPTPTLFSNVEDSTALRILSPRGDGSFTERQWRVPRDTWADEKSTYVGRFVNSDAPEHSDLVRFNEKSHELVTYVDGGRVLLRSTYPASLGRHWINDVNGDGLTDVVGIDGTRLVTLMSTGNGDFDTIYWEDPNQSWTEAAVVKVGDVDGDGMGDFVAFAFPEIVSIRSSGLGLYEEWRWTVSESFQVLGVGDLNGDKKADVVGYQHDAASGKDNIVSLFGLGDGTFVFDLWTPTIKFDPTSCLLGDFNGDGKLDILSFFVADSATQFKTFYSFASSTTSKFESYEYTVKLPMDLKLGHLAQGDYNYDGKSDIVFWNSAGTTNQLVTLFAARSSDGKFDMYSSTPSPFYPKNIITTGHFGESNTDVLLVNTDDKHALVTVAGPRRFDRYFD